MEIKMPMRWVAMLLAIILTVGAVSPVVVRADDGLTYSSFLSNLKVLESYADSYSATTGENPAGLVINYIRTGVERYTTDTWTTMAGPENTAFTAYVTEQDAANGTTAGALRDINTFAAPNGQIVEFGHMFGSMNMTYTNKKNMDLGSWAGDLCDLIVFAKAEGVTGDIETMVAEVRENCLGAQREASGAFDYEDIYGDLDSYYLMNQVNAGSTISAAMEGYFTADLTDNDRAAYFLNNRFSGLQTQEDVRTAIYDTYKKDVGIKVLESSEGITGDDADLRTACCYAFADYLFDLAADRLEGDTGEETTPTDPTQETDPVETDPTDPSQEPDDGMDKNAYYSVFSSTESQLAPGISQTIKYAQTVDDKQLAYYITTVDVNREDVGVQANYKDHNPSLGWGMQRVQDQLNAAQAFHSNPEDAANYIENFNVIAGTNGDFYNMSTGKPSGALVMGGVEYTPVGKEPFFAILDDGSAVIGTPAEWGNYAGRIQEAIGGNKLLVQNGESLITPTTNYANDRASRTCVGITADGKVVLMVLDGRQEPFSAGGSYQELAQIMLDAGCEIAMNIDGGGSTTYVAKPEGSDTLQLINRPSDGYARSVSSSLLVYSTAKVSNEFSHAVITSDYDYLTIGSSVSLNATGVSDTGNFAEIPEDAFWQVSDSAVGTVEDGVFTAADNGTVEVRLMVGETVVGSKTLNVVIPDALAFEKDSISMVYGVSTELPLTASYNGNPCAFLVDDVMIFLGDSDAGTLEGLTFTPAEEAGIRSIMVAAMLLADENVFALTEVRMYKAGEAVFDFDDITAGDRKLAWKREVSNSTTKDEIIYHIDNVEEVMNISYVFGLDMEAIEIPEKLMDLTDMLPGADAIDATAWNFLMQLAERVSVLTEVKVVAHFDPDLEIDYSGMTIVNDYFTLKSVELNEADNTLTVTCGWIDQTAAIDPATANPICILSGIKATAKDGAEWDAKNQLAIDNAGTVSYNIYLRASALYNFANNEENQKEYDLYPFVNPNDPKEKGASFGTEYANFEDKFVLDKTCLQGWYSNGNNLYYMVDNKPVTGIQKLPSQEDPTVDYFYRFEDDGSCAGAITGIVDWEGGKYYAIQGDIKTGWRAIFNAQGKSDYYYFDLNTGKAVNGEQKINGYNYVFTDYILTRGQIVKNATGYRYIWAGAYILNQWIELDGNYYFAQRNAYFVTDGLKYVRSMDNPDYHYHLFDDKGVFQKDVSGLYHVGEDTYLMKDGVQQDEPGLVYIDGYYYYFCSTGKAVKNRTYWPTKTNGLLPMGPYNFDEFGRITNVPGEPEIPTEPTDPVDPSAPTDPSEPEEVKNGIVAERGALYFYKDGLIQYSAGLVQLEDGSYIYVRSNGQLAIGSYWITNNHDLLPQAMYVFGEDGKMLNPPTDEPDEPDVTDPTDPTEPEGTEPTEPAPAKKNGIVEVNGKLYYYQDDAVQYCAGLVKLEDGSYIYVRSNGQLAIGKYWVTNNNDLLPQKEYVFGQDGKMVNAPGDKPTEPDPTDPTDPTEPSEPSNPTEPSEPVEPAVKNGIVAERGALYYYKDNAIQYGAGLVKLEDGSYIYVRSNGQLAIGNYWPTTTNNLLPAKMYTFGADGKLWL